jgi:hypothetical protein
MWIKSSSRVRNLSGFHLLIGTIKSISGFEINCRYFGLDNFDSLIYPRYKKMAF